MNHKPPSPRWNEILSRKGQPLSVGTSVDKFLRKQLGIHEEDDLQYALAMVEKEMDYLKKPDDDLWESYSSEQLANAIGKTLAAWDWDFSNPSFRNFLRELCNYFGKSNEKGLLIVGPPGLGKSKIMQLMSKMVEDTEGAFKPLQVSYIVHNWTELENALTRKIRRDWQKGDERKCHLCIDDIGREIKENVLGGRKGQKWDFNPIEVIIDARHRLWERHGVKTHLITNYSSKELQDMYGPALFDRMFGMSNTIKIEGKSKR